MRGTKTRAMLHFLWSTILSKPWLYWIRELALELLQRPCGRNGAKKAFYKTRMELQLADGSVEQPLGLLEHVIIKACGIKFEHTFAIVNLKKTLIMR